MNNKHCIATNILIQLNRVTLKNTDSKGHSSLVSKLPILELNNVVLSTWHKSQLFLNVGEYFLNRIDPLFNLALFSLWPFWKSPAHKSNRWLEYWTNCYMWLLFESCPAFSLEIHSRTFIDYSSCVFIMLNSALRASGSILK